MTEIVQNGIPLDYKRHFNLERIKEVQKDFLKYPVKHFPGNELLKERISDLKYRNSGDVTKRVIVICRPPEGHSSRSDHSTLLVHPKKMGVTSYFQIKMTKRLCDLRRF